MGLYSEETTLAYFAGFFDGEGCITIRASKDDLPYLILQTSQKSIAVLEEMRKVFGGNIHTNTDGSFIHVTAGKYAEGMLRALLPYLFVKLAQAELAIEFCNIGQGKSRMFTEDELQRRRDIDMELRRLKKVV